VPGSQEPLDWWHLALGDLHGAQVLAADPSVPPRLACGLSQQSAEKAIKAALVFERVDFPKSHDLNALRELLPDDWALRAEFPDLTWLADWIIDSRYPENLGGATDADSVRAVSEAREVLATLATDLLRRGLDIGRSAEK
jgi:HEPN domain-containing protein